MSLTTLSQASWKPPLNGTNIDNGVAMATQASSSSSSFLLTCIVVEAFLSLLPALQVNLDLTSLLDSEDKKSKNKRGVLPKHATNIMRSWLFQHLMVSKINMCI